MLKHMIVIITFCAVFHTGCSSFMLTQQNHYVLISNGSSEDTLMFLKYSANTGQSWILSDEWIPIQENEKIPESEYEIKIVTMPEHIFAAVRIDTLNGRSWSSINNQWVEIKSK